MKLLLDTHLLPKSAGAPARLSPAVRNLIDSPDNEPFFGAASLWENVIKRGLGRDDIQVERSALRHALLDNGYGELPIGSRHMVAVGGLPRIHKDPFDHILVAQAQIEGLSLVTADPLVAQYPGPIRRVSCTDRPGSTPSSQIWALAVAPGQDGDQGAEVRAPRSSQAPLSLPIKASRFPTFVAECWHVLSSRLTKSSEGIRDGQPERQTHRRRNP